MTNGSYKLRDASITNNEHSDEHLHDLKDCDTHGKRFLNSNSSGLHRVVGKHESVDSEVHGHNSSAERKAVEVSPVNDHHPKIIPVKEYQVRFAKNDEHRVFQLKEFGDNKSKRPEGMRSVFFLVNADRMMKSIDSDCSAEFVK